MRDDFDIDKLFNEEFGGRGNPGIDFFPAHWYQNNKEYEGTYWFSGNGLGSDSGDIRGNGWSSGIYSDGKSLKELHNSNFLISFSVDDIVEEIVRDEMSL